MDKARINEIMTAIKTAIDNKEIKVVSAEGHRYYTDVLTESLHIPLTTVEETAEVYERLVLLPKQQQDKLPKDLFLRLPRVSMFIGQPDTGKTYTALQIAKDCGITPLFKMCNEDMNLETFMKDFHLVDGKPVFDESLAIKKLSGTDREIIIMDEWNTMGTGAMKTMQPILDDTSTHFEYNGKLYTKNMNCKFIITLNDKDKGISIVPDAILSRSALRWFEPVPTTTLAKWTGVDIKWVTNLYSIYKLLGLLSVFGTRQIKMLHGYNNIAAIKNHLYGLCMMKNIDNKLLDTLQLTQLLNQL